MNAHRRDRACFSAVSAAFLIMLLLCLMPQLVRGEYTQDDFWWLAGEADKEHATFAPAADRLIKRDLSARIETVVPRKHFVASEPIQIRYRIFLPFTARLADENGQQPVAPFEAEALHVGRRRAVPHVRDLEVLEVALTLRLPSGYGYGTYIVPPFRVFYEYESLDGKEPETVRKEVSSEEVVLRKVPAYLDVSHSHPIVAIGEPFAVFLAIHADTSVQIMNEYPPEQPRKGIIYLASYQPDTPFVLLGRQRTESEGDGYKVIRWRYVTAAHDIGREAFEFQVPPVVWRQGDTKNIKKDSGSMTNRKGWGNAGLDSDREETDGPKTISPEALLFKVRSITEGKEQYRPLKGMIQQQDLEKRTLFSLPLVLLMVLSAGAFLWLFAFFLHYLKVRGQTDRMKKEALTEKRPRQTYDRWPWQRISLVHRADRLRASYGHEPTEARCLELRDLLARLAVSRPWGKGRFSIQQACAMTAAELEKVTGEKSEIDEIRELDRQLSAGEYKKIP